MSATKTRPLKTIQTTIFHRNSCAIHASSEYVITSPSFTEFTHLCYETHILNRAVTSTPPDFNDSETSHADTRRIVSATRVEACGRLFPCRQFRHMLASQA
jgi:hypothetical protein